MGGEVGSGWGWGVVLVRGFDEGHVGVVDCFVVMDLCDIDEGIHCLELLIFFHVQRFDHHDCFSYCPMLRSAPLLVHLLFPGFQAYFSFSTLLLWISKPPAPCSNGRSAVLQQRLRESDVPCCTDSILGGVDVVRIASSVLDSELRGGRLPIVETGWAF